MTVASLTRPEAEERAALLAVSRYDIDVDLTGLLDGEVWEATSTVQFTCHRPGADTFADAVGEVVSASLNGVDLDPATVEAGRLPLSGLAAENTLVVRLRQTDVTSSAGILRTVDPSDGEVYVWTSLECNDARRLWACFDQPDLKAPHRFTVRSPEAWTVLSNMRPETVGEPSDGTRRWSFPDTPPLSTYVVVVNAGPFHRVEGRRGDHDLALHCRQSLRGSLDRDAGWLLDLTGNGLAFFGDKFGQPFPEAHYDQVFVPNMGGAMENWGCVTWGDGYLFRTPPTHAQRSQTAITLLHEMAHMWFGDLVTMRWWDDLWLNEAFASWASTWAAAEATDFLDAWAEFLVGRKLDAYRTDMGPATHPIRSDVLDVESALANFDAITYSKGQSVLHQLMAFVGEDAFTRGLQDYFATHAWGNTRLRDLIDAVSNASGRDLEAWTIDWLDRAGTDTVAVEVTTAGAVVTVTSPDDAPPRPHRIDIGSYGADGALLRRTPVETVGTRTPVTGLPDGALHLPNDTDLTFASVGGGGDVRALLRTAGGLPDATARAVAVATSLDLLRKGEIAAADMLDCVLGVLAVEKNPALIEPFIAQARDAAEMWTPADQVDAARARVADLALTLSREEELRRPALQVLASCATTSDHDRALAEAAAEDVDLSWRFAVRRSERGDLPDGTVEELLARDPDPDRSARAVAVTAARPDEAAKAEAWEELFVRRSVQAGHPTFAVARAFWRPGQAELCAPWADRYLEEMRAVRGGLLSMLSLVRGMFPLVADEGFADRARAAATEPGLDPTVRNQLLTGADTLSRMIRARRGGA
ncbi:aminopeptidase N [Nocardioides aestuarii]|uniref:Aminopeptidase N n=1 Tax=Nocardioides aestuarii TaxID=252231 RepID=A0ABW4TT38_9ACTN